MYANGGHAYVVVAGLRFDTSMRDPDAPGPGDRPALVEDPAHVLLVRRPPPARLLARPRGRDWPEGSEVSCRAHGSRHERLHREDRGAAGHHRDGPPVRRQRGPPDRRGARPRGHLPGGGRGADEGARPVRRDDPRGVRRDGPRPHHLRDDRRGALARLDLGLRHREHALHRLLPADEVRHRRAEGALPAADGDRRAARGLLALRARVRLGRAGHQVDRQEDRRRRLGAERPEDVGHERARLGARVRAGEERPQGRAGLQGHDLLPHREDARGRSRTTA